MRAISFRLWALVLALAGSPGGSEARAAQAAGLAIQKNVAVGGKQCDVVTWTDANGRPRSVALVRADGDPGYSGGYVQRYTYYVDASQKTGVAWDAAQTGVSGLGCAVNHHSGASTSKANSSNATTAFLVEGQNHCIWRFRSNYSGDGTTVGLVIDWLIASGRNDILWAVSYDASAAGADFAWDARGPYVQFDWDGDGNFYGAPISGIRWGDRYRFRTVNYNGAASTWDYTQSNMIPYTLTWKNASLGDLELGIVQTQPWTSQDAGGYWWAAGAWGTTGSGMPQDWNCPFQLNAYEGYAGEKVAWGTNYGYVGTAQYDRLDGVKQVGRPRQGYATFIILNKSSDALTDAMIGSMEAVQGATLTASVGSVVTSGPDHAGLAGNVTYQPAGWDHVRAAWTLNAGASGQASFNLSVPSGSIVRPTFVVNGYASVGAPSSVTLNGSALAAGTDYYASVETAGQKLWITFARGFSGSQNGVALSASGGAPPPPAPPPVPPPAPGPPAAPAAGGDGGDGRKCGCSCVSPGPTLLWMAGLAGLVILAAGRRR